MSIAFHDDRHCEATIPLVEGAPRDVTMEVFLRSGFRFEHHIRLLREKY